jgi:UPF0755 protein
MLAFIYTTAIVRKLFGLLIIVMLAVGGWLAWVALIPVEPAPQTFVMLRPGFSTRHIAAALKSAGVIRSEQAFILWHYLYHRRSLKAGEYLFEKPASLIDIEKRLQRGDVYYRTVVVPEGFTMFDIARAIEAAGLGPAEEFLKVAQSDTALISDIAPTAPSLEGYLFPETYQFSRMMSMQEMAAAMACQFRMVAFEIDLVDPAAAARSGSSPSNSPYHCSFIGGRIRTRTQGEAPYEPPADPEHTVIMASIIEKETSVAEERPMVASVYYNRLQKNIALDADPSIIYAELLTGAYQGALHHPDMQFPSRYNTYKHAGLPPGPIANPGKSSLEAAMHPAQTDYYYFVADAQGHHRFAHTIEEHNKNVAAYRRAMQGH